MHDREARLWLCSTLTGDHIWITELKLKVVFVKNKRSLTIAVTVTFKAQKGFTLFYQGPRMMELRYETFKWTTAELLWNCPATRTFHKPDAILASWLDLFLKRMGHENPGCTGNAKCWVVSKLLNTARVTVDFLFGNYGRFHLLKLAGHVYGYGYGYGYG